MSKEIFYNDQNDAHDDVIKLHYKSHIGESDECDSYKHPKSKNIKKCTNNEKKGDFLISKL